MTTTYATRATRPTTTMAASAKPNRRARMNARSRSTASVVPNDTPPSRSPSAERYAVPRCGLEAARSELRGGLFGVRRGFRLAGVGELLDVRRQREGEERDRRHLQE